MRTPVTVEERAVVELEVGRREWWWQVAAAVAVERREDAPMAPRRRREETAEIVAERRRPVLGIEADRKLRRLALDGRRVGGTEALEVRT